MALLVAEGFDDVSNIGGNNSHLGKVYSYSGVTIGEFQNSGGVWGGRFTHGYAKGLTNTNSNVRWDLPSPRSTLFFACAIRRTAAFSSVTPRIQFRRDANVHVDICFGGTDGSDLVVRVAGSQVGPTVSGVFPSGSYVWISAHVYIHNTNGIIEIKDFAGNTLFSFFGNTYNSSAGAQEINNVLLPTGGNNANNTRIDDVFILDDTGTSWNGHLTDTMIRPLYVSANGDLSTGWSPVGATDLWDCVDEAFFDGDTTYVTNPNAGARISFNIQDPPGSENIRGIIVNSACRRDDANPRQWKNFLRISGQNYDDPDSATSATNNYVHRSSIWFTNPATGNNWGFNDVVSLQIGVVT